MIGGVSMRDVVRFFLGIFFLSFTFTSCILVFDYLTYIVLIFEFIYVDVCYSPIFTCVVSFLSLCICFLFIVCNLLYFCFIQRCRDEFCLKCFRNTGCQNISRHELSSCKVFSRVYVRIDFIVFYKWVWVEWFMTSLICSFVCCDFVMNCQRGRLLEHMWFNVRNICQYRID